MNYQILILPILVLSAFAARTIAQSMPATEPHKPTLFIIGDSTVKNGRDNGSNGQWGWGHILPAYFDPAKITVENHAVGGTSSRSYMETPSMWPAVLEKLQPGDFVMMQFGHNDNTMPPETDTLRYRSTIKGNGEETVQGPVKSGGMETIHSYGWYIRQYITQTQAKGATPIVCSLIPRDSWSNGKINRADNSYGLWAKEAADQAHALFLPLNTIIADHYDKLGHDASQSYFPPKESTHTNWDGAVLNAQCVVEGIKALPNSPLTQYLAATPAEMKNPNPTPASRPATTSAP